MGTLSKIWNGFLNIFGLRKNSKYVKNYLNEANMRSGVFMSFVIFVLEVWLVIRQMKDYAIPRIITPKSNEVGLLPFEILYKYTSVYFVLMFFGIAMFVYSLQYLSKKKSLSKMIIPIVAASFSLAVCCFLPLEFKQGIQNIRFSGALDTTAIYSILRLVFYGAIFLFDIDIIYSSIYRYKGGKRESISSVLVISLFAFVCLTFGVMVSYSDFTSSTIYTGIQVGINEKTGDPIIKDVLGNDKYNKQIICFLMFTIYIGCLLIWNPMISIGILGTLFLGFFFLLDHVASLGGRVVTDGDKINYITFYISLAMVAMSIYSQRLSEAKKDEELEELATKDTITGLLSFEYFTLQVREKIAEYKIERGNSVYLFINITNFKVYNDQKGFKKGNEFLKTVGQIISDVFNENSLITRQSDDHFVVFTTNLKVQDKIFEVARRVEETDPEIKPSIKVGAAEVYDPREDPHYAVEKARYAYAELKRMSTTKIILFYDDKMHDNYLMNQYIVTHIDEAINNGYLKAYYQPVVWSKGRTLCGVEALARWIDPKYGFLSPGKFIPVLENNQLVYKLDKEILRIVCADIRHNMDKGLPVLPVSINFSRADFGIIDIVEVVNEVVDQYQVPHELLHVEITESALTNEVDLLKNTINRLHAKGFATWLDDFGSGYSSFNVLKDFDFDVLKLDMAFLVGFNGNEKAKALIKSVISLADQIGMKTLCEGVETDEQAKFLEEVSCGRLQGYLYGKPLSYDELLEKIQKGEYSIADEKIN